MATAPAAVNSDVRAPEMTRADDVAAEFVRAEPVRRRGRLEGAGRGPAPAGRAEADRRRWRAPRSTARKTHARERALARQHPAARPAFGRAVTSMAPTRLHRDAARRTRIRRRVPSGPAWWQATMRRQCRDRARNAGTSTAQRARRAEAARMEGAAGGGRSGVRDLALQHDAPPAARPSRIGNRHGGQQDLRIGMRRRARRAPSRALSSTMRPRYITATRSEMWRTTERSWAMNR